MWLWSWFLNKLLLLYQYLLIQYKGFRFNYDAKHSTKQKLNRHTLFNILEKNKSTKFLIDQRKKSNINNDENFKDDLRKLFPKYTNYSDYKPYVTEIMNNGNAIDILSIGSPIALTNTSGTSGDPKYFPL